MNQNPLGKPITPEETYNPGLLFSIPRAIERDAHQIKTVFTGYDVWNAYELSWLSPGGKPEVRRAQIIYSALSLNLIESKSLKLYLNSFSMSPFKQESEVIERINTDLNKILKTPFLKISLYPHKSRFRYTSIPDRMLLDKTEVLITRYQPTPDLLQVKECRQKTVERFSDLLKTNCPITGLPDWGSVYIKYKAARVIDDVSLLSYIISYRNHNDYHEATCEKIFTDLYNILSPTLLIVKCFYTRRGGIDINPFRYFGIKENNVFDFRYWRQ